MLLPMTRAIDLGCGAGAVGQVLRAEKPTLHVTGIDIANVPRSGDPQVELMPETAMESLPFADGAFGAAASQFGYEYGKPEIAAKEIARVHFRSWSIIPGSDGSGDAPAPKSDRKPLRTARSGSLLFGQRTCARRTLRSAQT
jgi:hypothetical protein